LINSKERKRRPPDLSKAPGPGLFPLRWIIEDEELRIADNEELKQARKEQRNLVVWAVTDRLEALATRVKKNTSYAMLVGAQIWQALDSEQAKLAPSIGTQIRTKRAIRNWRLGKSRDWVQDPKSGELRDLEVNYGPRIDPDFAASLVRCSYLRGERGYSEERAVKEATGTKEVDLNAIELRAFELVLRKRGFSRANPKDRDVQLAKAVLGEWLPSESDFRLIAPTQAPALTIEKIVHIVIPFLDEVAGRPISYSVPPSGEDDPAKLNPALGALVAIARIEHPDASLERVRSSIRSYRKLKLMPGNETAST
jgi:hypothetical protein